MSAAAESWQETTVPKPRAVNPRGLGTGKGMYRDAKPMPLPGQEVLRSGAHARCVEHVEIPGGGLSEPVCILRGQDRDAVIAEARELAGLG